MVVEMNRLSNNPEPLLVEYSPKLDTYYIPSKSRKGKIAKWPVYESRNKLNKKGELKWFCDCEDWTMNNKFGDDGDCRHVVLAKFYVKNAWARKYLIIRVND